MANVKDRLESNVAGSWFVDSNCIDCDLCRETAPMVFRRDDALGFSVVYQQPGTAEEKAWAEEAKRGCPVEAIGEESNDSAS
jgi:ferredoxin